MDFATRGSCLRPPWNVEGCSSCKNVYSKMSLDTTRRNRCHIYDEPRLCAMTSLLKSQESHRSWPPTCRFPVVSVLYHPKETDRPSWMQRNITERPVRRGTNRPPSPLALAHPSPLFHRSMQTYLDQLYKESERDRYGRSVCSRGLYSI